MTFAAAQSNWLTAAIATIVAAAVSALVTLLTNWADGIRQEQARQRGLYADAFAVITAYREFAYVIRRRRPPVDPDDHIAADERVRISEGLRDIQKELAYFAAWIASEAVPRVARDYEALVSETRRLAGGYMRDAWKAPALDDDSGMNISDIDFSPLEPLEKAYLASAQEALGFWKIAFPSILRPRSSQNLA